MESKIPRCKTARGQKEIEILLKKLKPYDGIVRITTDTNPIFVVFIGRTEDMVIFESYDTSIDKGYDYTFSLNGCYVKKGGISFDIVQLTWFNLRYIIGILNSTSNKLKKLHFDLAEKPLDIKIGAL